jgi:membrane-bound inhibitor of C-type lysozyme
MMKQGRSNAAPCAGLMIACAAMLTACGGMNLTRLAFWTNEPTEQRSPRLAGTTQFSCDGNKRLAVRFGAAGQPAMVVFPEREFRLDVAPGGAGRYSNGRTTLTVNGDEASLDEAGASVLANCKRVAAAK